MRKLICAAAALSLVLAACGSDDDNGGSSTPRPTVASQGVQPATQGAAATQAVPTTSPEQETDGNAPGIPVLTGEIQTNGQLRYIDEVVGTGPPLEAGQRVAVHYTGWLVNGTKFDSSRDRGQPYEVVLGANRVIQGWEVGLSTMNVGGKRRLIIPASLGYGSRGSGAVIPPNATLIFDVEAVSVQP